MGSEANEVPDALSVLVDVPGPAKYPRSWDQGGVAKTESTNNALYLRMDESYVRTPTTLICVRTLASTTDVEGLTKVTFTSGRSLLQPM